MTTKLKPSSRSKKRRASKAKKRSKKSFAQITTLCKQIHLEQLWSDLIKDDAVRADLNFQSRVRWPESNRKSYMTSLLLRMAPSKFIFASTESCKVASKSQKDIEYYDEWGGLKVQFLNIDSNNRVTTIKGFMNDEFGLQSGIYNIGGVTIEVVEGKNDTYSNLDGIIKSTLMTAPITIEIITQATRKQLSDQFIRMNDGVYLNGPEKRNAIISDFSTVIRDLATKYEKILSVYLTPSQVGRRGVDDFIAGVAFVSMHGSGVKITDKTLWAAYNENSQESEMVFAFESDFDKFMSVMKPYVNLVNKNSILDLIVIWKEQINQTRLLDDVEGFFKHFGKVHASLLNDPTLYEVSKGKSVTYKELCRSREAKYNLLRRLLLDGGDREHIPNTKERLDVEKYFSNTRDIRRVFSKDEKLIAAYKQDWITPEGKVIEPEDLFDSAKIQGGHIEPWSDGGETNQENCVIQTAEDNRKLGANPVE